jgi:hypothetical protein
MKPACRSGFSLIEVLLATSILLGSLIVLGQLAAVGRKHAHDAEAWTTAQLSCQSKLNEILAGIELVRSVQEEALPDAPGWVYSVEVEPAGRLGLASLRVIVSEDPAALEEAGVERRLKQFSLTRWISDPYRESTTDSPFGESLGDRLGDSFGDSFQEVPFDE